MALDVKATIAKILVEIGGQSTEAAKDTIHQLQRNGRLMEEYFGWGDDSYDIFTLTLFSDFFCKYYITKYTSSKM